MKAKKLRAMVQKEIDKDVQRNSRHFSSEVMDRQMGALIKVLAPILKEVDKC